jgi:hypothetical protein
MPFHGLLKLYINSGSYWRFAVPGENSRCPLSGGETFLVHFKVSVGFGNNEAVCSSRNKLNASGACSLEFIFRISFLLSWSEYCRMRVPASGFSGLGSGKARLESPSRGFPGPMPDDNHLGALVCVESWALS